MQLRMSVSLTKTRAKGIEIFCKVKLSLKDTRRNYRISKQ